MGKNTKACVDMFNTLYGAYLSLKKIHFTTTSQAEHLRTDNASGDVVDYADKFMEGCMGLFGRIEQSDIKYVNFGEYKDDKSLYQSLRKKLAEFRKTIENNIAMNGIVNIIDDFATDLNKWIYLSDNK